MLSDSDSYTKWGAALASKLPEGWHADLALLLSEVLPSSRQLGAALAGTDWARAGRDEDAGRRPRHLHLDDLLQHVQELRPDAVLLALRGPLVRIVAGVLQTMPDRPVLLAGFPGLTIPAVPKAIIYREQVDLIILHSRREIRDFTRLAERLPASPRFGLATLPFLPARAARPVAATDASHDRGARPVTDSGVTRTSAGGLDDARDPGDPRDPGDLGDVVFAVQAKVPATREERVHLVRVLAEAARRQPRRRFIIKVRARTGEAQTHAETFDLGEFARDPAVSRDLGFTMPCNLLVEDGPMSAHLERAAALVTVSSTAVLEAIAAGVPALLLDDYGVGPRQLNVVFEGSGLFGDGAALAAGAWRHPNRAWLEDNYFHDPARNDWIDELDQLVAGRAAAPMPVLPRRHNLTGGALRRAFERKRMLGDYDRTLLGEASVFVAVPARAALRAVRQLRRALTGQAAVDPSMPADEAAEAARVRVPG